MSKETKRPKLTLVPNAVPFSEAGKYSCEVMRTFIQHRFDYVSSATDPWLSVHFCPEISILNIERFRVSTKDLLDEHVTFNTTMSFCVDHALQEYFSTDPRSLSAIEIREIYFRQSGKIPGVIAEVINGFQNKFELSINNGPRKNVRVKRELIDTLSNLATSLGMHNFELANLCIFHTLSQAKSTIEDHITIMEKSVESAMHQVGIRNRAIKALLKEFEKEIKGK